MFQYLISIVVIIYLNLKLKKKKKLFWYTVNSNYTDLDIYSIFNYDDAKKFF